MEVEIGSIGGVEDGFGTGKSNYFEPKELLEFSRMAKFDLLALGIGNIHGEYKSLSSVRIDLLELSNNLIGKKPLVLHGGSGLTEKMINKSIDLGVVKINISTSLKNHTLHILKDYSSSYQKFESLQFEQYMVNSLVDYFSHMIEKY